MFYWNKMLLPIIFNCNIIIWKIDIKTLLT
nr:MAG TPA: hypothetical protein [Caudoviricetes sp.]